MINVANISDLMIFLSVLTHIKSSILNIPKQQETYDAIKYFSSEILDKVKDKFEDVTLTYGFCSFELSKEIKKTFTLKLINMRDMKKT